MKLKEIVCEISVWYIEQHCKETLYKSASLFNIYIQYTIYITILFIMQPPETLEQHGDVILKGFGLVP